MVYDFGGGGGWGDPLERDLEAVLDDVWDEYVSVEGALRDYGVVITGTLEAMDLAIDYDATKQLRADRSERGDGGMSSVQDRYRIGVDVGGTFTDCVLLRPDGSIVLEKTPTTPEDQSDGVLAGIARLAEAENMADAGALLGQCASIVHGTTAADNTMIQMTGAPTGLLVTEGFRDEIEMRRCYKEDIWDPSYPIARGRAGPKLLAHILFSKYGLHLPLNRQSAVYAREGIDLDVSTLADWVGAAAATLMPLVTEIRAHVFAAERIHADDTTVPVLAKGKTRTGRLWTYVRDDRPFAGPDPPAAVFFYSRDRSGEHPEATFGRAMRD